MRRKMFDVYVILGIVFSVIGIGFAGMGIYSWFNIDDVNISSSAQGDVDKLPLVFLLLGAPFLIAGVVFWILVIRKSRRKARLLEQGYYVVGYAVKAMINTSVSVNGVNPFFLECHYQDPATGQMHVFRSENLPYYPEELIGKAVKIYVDRENFSHYYVDVQDGFVYH